MNEQKPSLMATKLYWNYTKINGRFFSVGETQAITPMIPHGTFPRYICFESSFLVDKIMFPAGTPKIQGFVITYH